MYFFSALLLRLKRILAPLENPMDAGPTPGLMNEDARPAPPMDDPLDRFSELDWPWPLQRSLQEDQNESD